MWLLINVLMGFQTGGCVEVIRKLRMKRWVVMVVFKMSWRYCESVREKTKQGSSFFREKKKELIDDDLCY